MSMTIKNLADAIDAEIIGDADASRVVDGVAGAEGAKEETDRTYVAYWPRWMPPLTMCVATCAALIVPRRWAREEWGRARANPGTANAGTMRRIVLLGVDVRADNVDADLWAAQQRAAKALGVEAEEWRRPESPAAQTRGKTNRGLHSQHADTPQPSAIEDRVARDVARQWLPTSTHALERLRVRETSRLAANRKKDSAARHVKTAWGEATIKGNLTEVHGLILAAVMRGGRAQLLPGGQVEVEFTLGDICRALGAPKGKWPLALLDDLLDARLDVRVNATAARGEIIEKGHILDRVSEERRPCPGAANLTGALAGRHRRGTKTRVAPFARVMRVRIGDLFLKLWREDYCIYETPEDLATLYSMRRNVSRMVARFCKTHDPKESEGYTEDYLAALADAVNADRIAGHNADTTVEQRARDLARRRKLRHALRVDAELFNALGLTLAGGKVGFTKGGGK